jgi:hypothetical protein
MRRLSISIGLGVWLAMPGLAAAQVAESPSPPRSYEPVPGAPAGAYYPKAKLPDLKPMYEDIEILRRILNRDFAKRHQLGQCAVCHQDVRSQAVRALGSLAFSPDGKTLATGTDRIVRFWDVTSGKQIAGHGLPAHPFTGAEGTYLAGVGVVYTITLPPLPEDAHAPPAKPAPAPLSEWDRVRKQLLGEKVEAPAAPERKQASLTDTVLKALADNGRHFKQLGPNESLTVVITFRGSESAFVKGAEMAPGRWHVGVTADPNLPGSAAPRGSPPAGPRPGVAGAPGTPYQGPSYAPGGVPSAGMPPANPSTATDYALLADLQLKQGRVAEAIAGYQRAVELNPGSRELVSLYRKLAQAYLAQEQDAKARDAVERAMQFLKAVQKAAVAPVHATGMAAALPSQQLIISVPRSLLDRVAAGQISFPQFRDAAHVELRLIGDAAKKTPPQVRP